MAFFVDDDKGEAADEFHTYHCITNGKDYKYVQAEAEAVFTKYGFGSEDSKSMMEMTACNSDSETLTEASLEAGAAGLAQWKAAEVAREEEARAAKAAEAARAEAEYQAAVAAAAESEKAEALAMEQKQAADRAQAQAKAAEAAKPKPKKSMFGKLKAAAGNAFDAAAALTTQALAAAEVGWNTAREANQKRTAELKAAKAKKDLADAANAEPKEPAKKLTFFEQCQLNAKLAADEANALTKDAQAGIRAASKDGAGQKKQ